MIEGITTALSRLQNARLIAFGRAADLQWFTFAPAGHSDDGLRLHVQCSWRLVGPAGILIGAADYWRPATEETPEDDYDRGEVGTRLRDVRIDEVRRILEVDAVEVVATKCDSLGGFVLRMSQSLTLEVFPDASPASHHEYELWRLFQLHRPHFVVSTDGLDYVADV